ncbi:MAG: hypothetical protein SCH39_04980 [Methanosarcinales archaeon]|nr:hypothetical protein [ANME-2 cluster archaeon]MDF1531124.1 hypothetical protein [ANME-2 cluster archaeon]MDW7775679.1 hypothetical protein [Methanosarcinales archaeon]
MNLREILQKHKESFQDKLLESLSQKHCIPTEKVMEQFGDNINILVNSKYAPLEQVTDDICNVKKPVLINIRRSRQREDKCKICESNEPNIQALDQMHGTTISIFEISEDSAAGSLYHVLFKGAPDEDKKLPLTAIIHNGDVKRVWAGKSVETSVYSGLIRKALA